MISNSHLMKLALVVTCMTGNLGICLAADTQTGHLVTRWAKDVSQTMPWPEYPRPHLVRETWLNLNGPWDLAITDSSAGQPTSFDQKILVPFPLESYLGGLQRRLLPTQRAWYQRDFKANSKWQGQRLLLHFGAVDWHAEVWINGKRVGEHRGGYDPFTFDVTDAVRIGEKNTILVGVSDPSDSGPQPRGKQKLDPEGIWYTPVSGIWQTVWLEPVPASYVKGLKVIPDLENSKVSIAVDAANAPAEARARIEIASAGKTIATSEQKVGEAILLEIDEVRPWSPADPFLYVLRVQLIDDQKVLDSVSSYFGMRSIKLGTDLNGQTRMMFNGEPLFQLGPLDQGYWPDGLYTAPTDEALRYDLETAKELGFNMVRKHVKVEPARWYYWCDRLGLIVWQDMPSGDKFAPWPADGQEINRTEESAAQFRQELKAIVDALHLHPCIGVWVPFNEAWGQFDTVAITEWLEGYDPSRLIVSASGGNDFGCGHIKDDHFYPGPGGPPAEKDRAAVLGEFGGFGLPLRNHTWQLEQNWGYRSFESPEQLTAAYQDVMARLRPLVESHLSAAIYTQITDVEIEVNGLMTYDRAVLKMDKDKVRAAHEQLFGPLPELTESERVNASVLAWWRFEDGTPGKTVSDLSGQMGAISAKDFSGHNNHLFAYSGETAPSISDDVPHRPLTVVDVENKLCLDDTQPPGEGVLTRDLYVNQEVARTHMDMVNRFPFSSWTIEASFRLAQSTGEQVAVAKEEDRSGTMHPLFQLGVFGNPPTIGVEFVDEAGENVTIHSDVQAGTTDWWHVTVTCHEGRARLYISNDQAGSDFVFVGDAPVKGSLTARGGTWLVGRGSEGGKMGRDFFGMIDEVRISTKALTPAQFLFSNTEAETIESN